MPGIMILNNIKIPKGVNKNKNKKFVLFASIKIYMMWELNNLI
jgi:hypothetical protein